MKRYKQSVRPLFLLCLFLARSRAEELTLNVNFRQPVSVTDVNFLSLTLDPTALLRGNALSTDFEKSVNLAKALGPAYLRLGGAHGTFHQSTTDQQPQDAGENENPALTETEWVAAHNWAEKAGLQVIACVAPEYMAKEQQENSGSLEDAGNIVSFSNHMGFNASWQLGYECQSRCNISAEDLARQQVTLRKMLDKVPRYSNSLIVGPDIVAYETDKQKQYLRDYFSVAAPALSAITWHPDLDSVVLDKEGVLVRDDTLERNKEELFKVIGRFAKKKPLWIAESRHEACNNLYLGALVWARRLGSAAKLKVNVIMRRPSDLTQPTPDYWVSLLHKTLVGREVFDARVQSFNKSHVYLYCQCARSSSRYRKGSVAIFGVNLSPENVRFDLKGVRITTLHEYILSPGFDAPNRMFAESVLLNNRSLSLVNDAIPDLQPEILSNPDGLELNLQSGSVGFWVLPDLQIKSCMEDQQPSEMHNSRTNRQVVLRELQRKAENERLRAVRSTREKVRSERGKEGNGPRLSRESDAARDLKRLRRFVAIEMNSYTRKPTVEATDSEAGTRAIRQSKDQSEPLDIMQAKLEDFRNRLSRSLGLAATGEKGMAEDVVGEVVAKAMSLISKMQEALELAKRQTEYAKGAPSSGTMKNYLQALYDLLNNVGLTESSDALESGESRSDQRSKRAKRELLKRTTESGFDLETEARQKERARVVRDHRNVRKISGRDDRLRPNAPQWGAGDSEEKTFYGFFKTEPAEDFPRGDVFFSADDRYGDMAPSLGYQGHEPTPPHYEDPEDLYNEYYHEYSEPAKDSSQPFNRDRSTEFWETEGYEPQIGAGPENESDITEVLTNEDENRRNSDSRLRLMADYYAYDFPRNGRADTMKRGGYVGRPVGDGRIPVRNGKLGEQRLAMWDHDGDFVKHVNLPSYVDVHQSQRFRRRNPDLYAILDQEMIKEDDANLKDCDCRVIRSKRRAPESAEDEASAAAVAEEDVLANPMLETLDPHDATDVEVFSEIEGTPMEILQMQTEPSNVKIERNAETSENSGLETETPYPSGRASSTPGDPAENTEDPASSKLHEEYSSSMSGLNAEGRRDAPLTTPSYTVVDPGMFFREETGKSEEETATINTFEDTTEYTPRGQEDSTADEDGAKENETAKEIEVSSAETSGATLESATLSSEGIAKDAENDYNNDKAAGGDLKRHAGEGTASPRAGIARARGVGALLSGSGRNGKRARVPLKRKPPSSEVKPWEVRLMENARLLITLKRMMDQRRGQTAPLAAGLKQSVISKEAKRNRLQQYQKLKEALRNRQQRLMLKNIPPKARAVDEAEDDAEEERTLRRRETREMKEYNDPEKSDYVLMYEPDGNGEEEDANSESMEKGEAAIAEIVRARSPRERISSPKQLPNSHDLTIMEVSNAPEVGKIVQLKNLYEDEGTKGERAGEDRRGRSYFAVVEDLENPRIFHYHKSRDQRKRSAQMSPRFLDSEYGSSGQEPYYDNVEAIQESYEDDGASDEQLESREIYVIDPSTYSGGHPMLQLYRGPPLARRTNKQTIANGYEPTWEPILYKAYRVRQTEPRKHESSEARVDQRSDDMAERVAKPRDSRDLNANELLRILINSLNLSSAEELLKRLTGQSAASNVKQNLVRSVNEESRDEELQEDDGRARRDDERELEEWKGSEISGTQAKEESYQDFAAGREASGEDDAASRSGVASNVAASPEGILNSGGMTRTRRRRDTDQRNVLTMPSWAKKLNRHRRQAMNEGDADTNVEKEQPLKLQQLGEVSSPRIPTYMDDVEKSMAEKRPLEMHTKEENLANYINERRGLGKSSNENRRFSSFIEGSIPGLQSVVVDSLEKAQNITSSMGRLIENVDEKFNETSGGSEQTDPSNSKSISATQSAFHNAIMHVKKIFMLLGGITRILQG